MAGAPGAGVSSDAARGTSVASLPVVGRGGGTTPGMRRAVSEPNCLAGGSGTFLGNASGNIAGATNAAVVDGATNYACSGASFIGDGTFNGIDGNSQVAAILGGSENYLTNGEYSAIVGGTNNVLSNTFGFIRGRWRQLLAGEFGVVDGGENNSASGEWGLVGGGYGNSLESASAYGVVAGGQSNSDFGEWGVIGGGNTNIVNSEYGTIAGGDANGALAVSTQ